MTDEIVIGTSANDYLRDAAPNRPPPRLYSSEIHGRAGDDHILSYMGEDLLFGGKGDDEFVIYFNTSNIEVTGGNGWDTVIIHTTSLDNVVSDVIIDDERTITMADGQVIELHGVDSVMFSTDRPWDY